MRCKSAGWLQVMPAICTEEPSTLGAQLVDGTVIRGQNAISHPTPGALLLLHRAEGHAAQLP